MTFLEHLMLQSPVINGQLSILQNESLHNVAVVDIDREDLSETYKDIVLNAILRVDERC